MIDLRPGVYSVAEAAARMGVTESAVHGYIRQGRFPCPRALLRIGGRWRVSVAALDAHLAGDHMDEQVSA